jgi:hypothetical protein
MATGWEHSVPSLLGAGVIVSWARHTTDYPGAGRIPSATDVVAFPSQIVNETGVPDGVALLWRMSADAAALNQLGVDLWNEGRLADAEGAFRRAIDVSPHWAAPWFNLGLLFKIQRRWEDSAKSSRRGVEIDPSHEGAWWNLGIAATALGDWQEARRAWRGYGIDIPSGEGPLELNYGSVPLRLNPDDNGEVVWGRRIDPARAIIVSVPLPRSGFYEGDLVLHDGEPKGTRKHKGEDLDVFNVLQTLQKSGRRTYEAWVSVHNEADIETLEAIAEKNAAVVEDWSQSVRMICRQCSEGIPHSEHTETPVPWESRRHIGISAASLEHASALLMQWVGGVSTRQLVEIRPADAGDTQ